jgi:hypothetical protein
MKPSKTNYRPIEIDILARARFSLAATQDIQEPRSDSDELQDLIDSDANAFVDDIMKNLHALRKTKDKRSSE